MIMKKMYIYNKKTRYYLNDDNTILIFLPNFQNIVELRYRNIRAIWERIIKTQFDIPEKLLNQLIDIGVIYEKL